MTAYVALLRAVNVGGTGKLPMADLVALCEAAGLTRVRTYIASGNAIFVSDRSESAVKAAIEAELRRYAGKDVGVMVRNAAEMAAIVAVDPFPGTPRNHCMVIFLDQAPPADLSDGITGLGDETIWPGAREIYVHYPLGMGVSKLKIAAAKAGTARNMNTIAKLAKLAAAL